MPHFGSHLLCRGRFLRESCRHNETIDPSSPVHDFLDGSIHHCWVTHVNRDELSYEWLGRASIQVKNAGALCKQPT
jgi:hypothetical protein